MAVDEARAVETVEKGQEKGEQPSEAAESAAKDAYEPGASKAEASKSESARQTKELEQAGELPAIDLVDSQAAKTQAATPEAQAAAPEAQAATPREGADRPQQQDAPAESGEDLHKQIRDQVPAAGGHILPAERGETTGRLPGGDIVTAHKDGSLSYEQANLKAKSEYRADGSEVTHYRDEAGRWNTKTVTAADKAEAEALGKEPQGTIDGAPYKEGSIMGARTRQTSRSDGWSINDVQQADGEWVEMNRRRKLSDGRTETRTPDGQFTYDDPRTLNRQTISPDGRSEKVGPSEIREPDGTTYILAPDGSRHEIKKPA